MSATVINLEEYRRKKADEKSERSLRGRGFPKDFHLGPDDLGEDFGKVAAVVDVLTLLGLIPGEIIDDTED